MSITKEAVVEAIKHVKDPELGKTFHELGMIKSVEVEGNSVDITLELTTPACPLKGGIRKDIEDAVKGKLGSDVKVEVRFTYNVRRTTKEEYLPNVRNVILVGSGKGGVGKSTVAVNLALALRLTGASVGIMDTDIYGPSVPIMLGIKEAMFTDTGDKPKPPMVGDIPVLSIGFFLKDAQAVIWRGPLLHNTVKQFLSDFDWGELDYLVVDLPPGTGDIQLSISQLIHSGTGLLVSTPQNLAVADVKRAKNMFEKVNIPVLGLVVNMSTFVCPHCGEETPIFGSNAQKVAAEMGVDLLGELPIDPAIVQSGDAGSPVVMQDPEGMLSKRFVEIAEKVAAKLSVLANR